MNNKIGTRQYEFAHGKKPRGYGYWIFENDYKEKFRIQALYTEACRQALIFYKRNTKNQDVKVCS